jgi:hypothetical protein
MLPVSTGLHAPFGPSSTASTTILVRDSRVTLRLAGTLRVDTGTLQVRLAPPHGGDVFDMTYTPGPAPQVDELYTNPAEGTWTLRIDADASGTGRYDLDLRY